jgi:thioredoxin-related protein
MPEGFWLLGWRQMMLPCRRLTSLLAAAFLLPLAVVWANPDVPLPQPDTEYGPEDSFPLLLPNPDAIPSPDGKRPPEGTMPEDSVVVPDDAVVMPPPVAMPEDFAQFDGLSAPSDGEAMPELPYAPGLVVPKFRPGGPADGPGAPALPGSPESLLPLPTLDLKPDRPLDFWFPSPIQARRLAIKERKPLLLFFAQKYEAIDKYGMTACPSLLMNNDLLAGEDFRRFAGEKLILTSLQYPPMSLHASKLPEAKKEALQKFQDYFKVTGFPALIMIDENGRELLRIRGYRMYRDNNEQLYSNAHVKLDQLKEAVRRDDERKRARQLRLDKFFAQGYRVWTNRGGYTIIAKFVEASPERVVLRDENGALRVVEPRNLSLFDAEWAARKQAGTLRPPVPDETRNTADATP